MTTPKELAHQPLIDCAHPQRLLDAFIDELYNRHYHRELKGSPAEAFDNAISQRTVSIDRLHQAFFKTSLQRPHPKTGAVRINGRLWKVPSRYLTPRRQLRIAEDMLDPGNVYLLDDRAGRIPLLPAVRTAQPAPSTPSREYPPGSLSPLLEQYRGRTLPQAIGGFGLPEIYQRLAAVVGRTVPDTEVEAALILRWLKDNGPFAPQAFDAAMESAVNRLGPGRTLGQLLEELTDRIKRTIRNKEK